MKVIISMKNLLPISDFFASGYAVIMVISRLMLVPTMSMNSEFLKPEPSRLYLNM